MIAELDNDGFDALLYGAQSVHPNTMRYMENQFNHVTGLLTDVGRRFSQETERVFEFFSSGESFRKARAILRNVGSLFKADDIRELTSISDFQTAGLEMQRWLMAEPDYRKLYHQQRCEGFSRTYIDRHPGRIGEDHYDYRRAMNGLFVPEKVEGEEEEQYFVTEYFEELIEGDRELELSEQVDIQTSWRNLRAFVAHGGEDPGSEFGNQL